MRAPVWFRKQPVAQNRATCLKLSDMNCWQGGFWL